jgi:leucine dehydrogenase
VLLQGVGAVGGRLAELLHEAGARVIVCDINDARVAELTKKHGFESVPGRRRTSTRRATSTPPARAARRSTTRRSASCTARRSPAAPTTSCHEPRHGDELRKRGILYAPDYVINAGGIINVGMELAPGGYDEARALAKIDRIYDNLKQVFASRASRRSRRTSRLISSPTNASPAGRKQRAAVTVRMTSPFIATLAKTRASMQ